MVITITLFMVFVQIVQSIVINGITDTTTADEFNALIQQNPSFKIEHYYKGFAYNSISGRTALEMAASKGNYNLAKFIIKNYGNSSLSITNQFSYTPIFSVINNKHPNSYMILELFINSGACVNFPKIDVFENKVYVRTPLDKACNFCSTENASEIKKIKLLLIHGAQFGVQFDKKGVKILNGETIVSKNFNIQEVLHDKYDLFSIFKTEEDGGRGLEIFNQAMDEILNEKIECFPSCKFQFFLGTNDENSILKFIPKELVVIIFSNMHYSPSRSLRKKAEEMLTAVIIPKKMTS